jgi:hypothetical protein
MTNILKTFLFWGVILSILPGRGVAASPAGPIQTTPARLALDAWLTAFNSGDAKVWKAFTESYSWGVDIESLQKMRSANGGFILLRITVDENFRIDAFLKESNGGQRWQIRFLMNQNKPSSIAGMLITDGRWPLPK